MTKAQRITERAAFEAWVTSAPIEANIRLADPRTWPGQYSVYATQLAWEAWQASRKHTFLSVTTPVQLNNQKPCAIATEDALPLTGHPPQAGTQPASHSECRTQSASVTVRSRLEPEPAVTSRM
jgi:hypothetical protein